MTQVVCYVTVSGMFTGKKAKYLASPELWNENHPGWEEQNRKEKQVKAQRSAKWYAALKLRRQARKAIDFWDPPTGTPRWLRIELEYLRAKREGTSPPAKPQK